MDIDEIEDILNQIMTDEFNTTLEDDSPYLVAKHLVLLFNQCINGNFTEVERLREKAKTQNAFVASSCVKQGDDNDSDDEGDSNNVSLVFCIVKVYARSLNSNSTIEPKQ